MYRFACALLALAAAAAGQTEKERIELFVSPAGNDAWSGTLAAPNAEHGDGPFATPQRAQAAARNAPRPVTVTLRGGFYELNTPLVFTAADSGRPGAPVVYRAFDGERPILSAARRIRGFEVGRDGRWRVTLPAVRTGTWRFAQLFVGDQRRFRPRLPANGFFHVAAALPPTPRNNKKGHDRFVFAGTDIRADWRNRDDVELLAFHIWSASRMRIASVDAAAHRVVFTGPTRTLARWGAFGKGARYRAYNVAGALGAPGSWYLDRPSGVLTYVPRAGESPDRTVVVAPRLRQVVRIAGSDAKPVEHLMLRGLTFAHAAWTLPPAGQSFPQAEVGLDAAVSATGARDVVLERCVVRHVGQYAVWLGAGCRACRIEHCEFVDLGGGGVKIGPGAGANPKATVADNVVRDNLIAHGGRLHPAAEGVWIGHATGNRVLHNDIFDFYYTAISVGWVWGYAESRAHHNEIGFNHIHTIGQRLLSDMGGVYTLGVSPGTRVHHNVIHDIRSRRYGGWGLYTDEGSSRIVMDHNLVYGTSSGGFHQHYGRDNRITNNIFAAAVKHELQRTRAESHLSFVLERNIVYWSGSAPLLGGNWRGDGFRLDHNLYWNTDRRVTFPGGLSLAQWRAKRGQDADSLVADPGFVNPAAGDFRLRDGSPAARIGFEPFDASIAGRTKQLGLTRDLPPVPPGFD